MDELCIVCERIDFYGLFQIDPPKLDRTTPGKDHRRFLGRLSDICEKNYCAFCRMVIHLAKIEENWGRRTVFNGQPQEVLCFIHPVDFALVTWRSKTKQRIRRLAIRFSSNSSTADSYSQIQLLDDSVTPQELDMWKDAQRKRGIHVGVEDLKVWNPVLDHGSMYRGRLVYDRPRRSLISAWLAYCSRKHEATCRIFRLNNEEHNMQTLLKSQYYPGKDLRIIDVQAMKLRPARHGLPYIALSYQWGGISMLKTSKANFEALSSKNGIREDELPRTVRDAIHLCKNTGWKYLWVDAICIIQDDEEDKQYQVSNMHSIYRHADLTIVAAGGSDANAGLNGVTTLRKVHQCLEKVQGLRMVMAQPVFNLAVEKSRWNTRAWTFQERLLSTRILVFTDGQMFFRCQSGLYSEDTKMEDIMVDHTHKSDSANLASFLTSGLSWRQGFSLYKSCVAQYTRRQFSYPADILDAFAGIIGRLKIFRELGHCWRCGIPEGPLLYALLWMPAHQSAFHRRAGTYTIEDTSQDIPSPSNVREDEASGFKQNAFDLAFPSWSWAGWVGAVNYFGAAGVRDGTFYSRRCRTWWNKDDAKSHNLLFIQAPTLEVCINRDGTIIRGTPFGMYKIQDSSGSSISEIMLDRAWFQSSQQINFDFILLGSLRSFREPVNRELSTRNYAYVSIDDADEETNEYEGKFFNAMLIDRPLGYPNEPASRVGLAYIPEYWCEDLWDVGEEVWETIILA
jgi:hypothetical protein